MSVLNPPLGWVQHACLPGRSDSQILPDLLRGLWLPPGTADVTCQPWFRFLLWQVGFQNIPGSFSTIWKTGMAARRRDGAPGWDIVSWHR